MKTAVVYNRESLNVINLFGLPNREKYGKKAIKAITDGLKKYGHQVQAFEGDKDLIRKLEEFMPRVLKGERPGMVFNRKPPTTIKTADNPPGIRRRGKYIGFSLECKGKMHFLSKKMHFT